ncbi:MAG: MarC family protein [Cyanobacteria bacterium J06632_22]
MTDDGLLVGPEYIKLLVGLLSLADPIGNLPVILALIEGHTRKEKEKIVMASVVTFIFALLMFAFLGTYILALFGITVAALKIAGGILFLFYGLEMLGVIHLPSTLDAVADNRVSPVGIVPIGIPILAGPGTMTKVLIYADAHSGLLHQLIVTAAIITAGAILYVLFRILLIAGKGPGPTVMTVTVKVMGLILSGIAVEFILEGIVEFLAG